MNDPRHYQIAVLVSLLLCGRFGFGLQTEWPIVAAYVGGALATQWLCSRTLGLSGYEPRSALISGLSLCLLLRTHDASLALLAAGVAMGSKFVLRVGGKHVFNPSNLAVTVMTLAADGAWLSPAQWGAALWFATFAAFLGTMTVGRSRRADISLAFLAFFVGGLFARAWWLGDPWAIPWRQAQNGALLIFAFLMISDPKATPDARAGRILFAAATAALGLYLRFGWYIPNGMVYALTLLSPLTPLIDRLLPGRRFEWRH